MSKNIRSTQNGKLFRCSSCSKLHIEFNNLNFNFNDKEFAKFVAYFEKLDGKYWTAQNQHIAYRRKIVVPLGHKNINMLLNEEELKEFKFLLLGRRKTTKIKTVKFDFQFNYN